MRILLASILSALITGLVLRFLDNWLTELGAAALIGGVVGLLVLFFVRRLDEK